MPIQTAGSLQHLSKVRIDLDDTRRALSDWAGVDGEPTVAEALLHRAVEGLMRALSTLTQVVEDAQRVEPAPTTAPVGWMFS